jgi:hypothetical protein
MEKRQLDLPTFRARSAEGAPFHLNGVQLHLLSQRSLKNLVNIERVRSGIVKRLV